MDATTDKNQEAGTATQQDPAWTELRKKLTAALDRHRLLVADTELTLAFISGNQYVQASMTRGIVPIENPQDNIRITENRMLNAYRRWLYYLGKEKPVLTAFEGGIELLDSERAKVASALFDYWQANCGMEQARMEMLSWGGVTGIGYIGVSWKTMPNLKRKRKELRYLDQGRDTAAGRDYTEEVEVEEPDGDISFDAYCPLQTFCFPLNARKWTQVGGILTADVTTREWLESRLGRTLPADCRPMAAGDVNEEALDRVNRFVSPEFGFAAQTPEADRFLVLQYFERPTRSHPDGQYLLAVGGKDLVAGKLPYLAEFREIDPLDQLNLSMGIIPWTWFEFPGRLIPPSPMGQLRNPQVRLNDLHTDQARNRKAGGRNKLIVEKGMLAEGQYTDESNEIIELKPGASFEPHFMQAPPLAGIENEIERALDCLNEASGQKEVLRGENPAQVRAAWHYELLREEAMTLLNADVRAEERTLELIGKMALALGKKRYSKERLIAIYGQDNAGHALSFKTANINLDIRIQTGSLITRSHAAYEAHLKDLLQFGAFNGKLDQFWQMSELGTMNRAVDHDQKQRIRARNENIMMLDGQPVMPFEHEDDTLHNEEHIGGMSRPEWYAAPDPVKMLYLTHVQHHARNFARKQAPETALPNADPVAGLGEDSAAPPLNPAAANSPQPAAASAAA